MSALPPDRRFLLDRLRADQSERWGRGECVRVESYLESHPELESDPEVVVELVYAEVLLRQAEGETPRLDEYLMRFPQFAEPIRRRWSVDIFLAENVAGSPGTTAAERRTQPAGPVRGSLALPTLPGYEVLRELGKGGMGVVFQARQVAFDRLVAVKMIRAQLLAGPDEMTRFRTEALAIGRLDHPHVVRVFDFDEERGCPYLVMEYLAGGSLAALLDDNRLPVRRAVELVRQVALGVQAAHDKGILHRDLKPGNVLLDEQGNARVADFGLAKLLDEDSGQTASAVLLGTPVYMAPEQTVGKARQVGPATDVWALGVMLYECLCGKPPFRSPDREEILRLIQTADPVPPRRLRREVPPSLEAICLKCLEKEPAKRYGGAGELADDLERFLTDRPIRARPRRWYEKLWRGVRLHPRLSLAGPLLVLLAGAGLVISARLDPERPRKQAERTLARGEAYVFEGHKELPGPFRWVLGDPGPPKANVFDRCVTIETLDLGLLELVRDPMCERYRLLAEIRHDGADGASFTGLYFGFRERQSAEGNRQGSFFTLSFADRGKLARTAVDLEGNRLGAVRLEGRCFSQTAGDIVAPHGPVGKAELFEPAEPVGRPGPWRTLAVEVGPQGVRALWSPEGGPLEEIGELIAPAALEDCLRRAPLFFPTLRDVPADFKPRSGLGICIFGGKASFRRVVLQPLGPATGF